MSDANLSFPKPLPIPAGSVFTITKGVYSDYGVLGVFRARVEIDTDVQLKGFLLKHPEARIDGDWDWDAQEKFVAWLTKAELIEPVPSFEMHLGDYSRLEIEVTKGD